MLLTSNQKGKMRTLTYHVDSNCKKQVLSPGLRYRQMKKLDILRLECREETPRN